MVTLIPIGAISGGGGSSGPVAISDVTGVTTTGLATATATDQAAGRTAIGAAADTAVLHKTGNESADGVKTFTSIPVLPASDPTTANQAVRKSYVDATATAAGTAAVAAVTPASINAVPNTRTIAGQVLNADVSASAMTGALSAATTTAKGTVELATNPEAIVGTDANLVITAASLAAVQRPLFALLNPYWPVLWVPGTGWQARNATLPQWYRDLGGLARYKADQVGLAAGSVTLPTDKQDKDRIYALPGYITGT